MNAAKLIMTYALLTQMMRLPEAAQIRGVRQKRFERDRFELFIEHPDLPEVEEGCVPAEFELIYEAMPQNESGFRFKSWQSVEDKCHSSE